MKQNTLLVLAALSISTAISGTTLAATGVAEGHKQEHGAERATAMQQLNAGKKWETDGALRQAMGNIREAVAASLHDIHESRLSTKGYAALAKKVESEVGNIVANCRLGPQADEQLHLVVADLLGGADQMAGKGKTGKRQDGAVRVIRSLEQYGQYFDDPGFKPIKH